MIKSFKSKETEKIYRHEHSDQFQEIQKTALRKLYMLDAAIDLKDLRIPPGNRIEKLKGERPGQYSIRVNDQWRICFTWKEHHAYRVEIIDYH